MKLKTFIKKYVEHNTLIRLQFKTKEGHREVIPGDHPMMEHELIKSVFASREVVGVTDILYTHGHYRDAVNLTIK